MLSAKNKLDLGFNMGIFSSDDMDTAIETLNNKDKEADKALIKYLSLFREYVIGADRALAVRADKTPN
jgi:hypothetical protein